MKRVLSQDCISLLGFLGNYYLLILHSEQPTYESVLSRGGKYLQFFTILLLAYLAVTPFLAHVQPEDMKKDSLAKIRRKIANARAVHQANTRYTLVAREPGKHSLSRSPQIFGMVRSILRMFLKTSV